MIRVQREDFDVGTEYQKLRSANHQEGAITLFCGLVRDLAGDQSVIGMELEHYPGMTEKVLENIVADAKKRWPLQQITVIHRIGKLLAGDQIVLVAASSAHREAAFEACQFIMDFLKTRATFWKKELTISGDHWVENHEKDKESLKRW